MKIRNSFVSNSSSCSFVIGKSYMTKDQVKKFAEFIQPLNERAEETYIFDAAEYFHGDLEQDEDVDKVREYLEEIGVDTRHCAFDQ